MELANELELFSATANSGAMRCLAFSILCGLLVSGFDSAKAAVIESHKTPFKDTGTVDSSSTWNGLDEERSTFESGANKSKPTAQSYYIRAVENLKKKEYKTALLEASLSIKENPKWALAYNLRARIYGLLGQYNKAMDDVRISKKIAPKDMSAFTEEGIVELRFANYDAALACFEKANKIKENADSLISCGTCLLEQGKLDEAIKRYEKALEIDPQKPGDASLGVLYSIMGQTEKSIEHHSRNLSANKDDSQGYKDRAWAYNNAGEFRKAIDDCTKAIELNKEFATAYSTRGTAYAGLGQKKKASRDFQKALELDALFLKKYGSLISPDEMARIYLRRAFIDLVDGKFQHAINESRKVIKMSHIAPRIKAMAYLTIARANNSLARYDDAVRYSSLAIDAFPYSLGGFFDRAYAYEHLGKAELASADYAKSKERSNFYDRIELIKPAS